MLSGEGAHRPRPSEGAVAGKLADVDARPARSAGTFAATTAARARAEGWHRGVVRPSIHTDRAVVDRKRSIWFRAGRSDSLRGWKRTRRLGNPRRQCRLMQCLASAQLMLGAKPAAQTFRTPGVVSN
jgi:hypothetical protein